MAELTPMKRQYNAIKEKHRDCLLFFRLGDFYEMFGEDAKTAARELDLTLTTRDRAVENPEDRTPMCGVPFHSSEAYIARLVAKGYKVAICEQMEDPAQAKGLVNRDVIRIITPGTVTSDSMLDKGRSNYLSSVFLKDDTGSVAFCDISTGEFCVAMFQEEAVTHILNELARFSPKEAVLNAQAAENRQLYTFLRKNLNCLIECGEERFELFSGMEHLRRYFEAETVEPLTQERSETLICAAGGLLSYLEETQKCNLSHINHLDIFAAGRYMELDYTTRRNLELTENLRTGEKKDSLLWVLDQTKTPMGGRLLRAWMERPLLSPVAIKRRLNAVKELYDDSILRRELLVILRGIGDMKRLVGRAVYGTANGRDLLQLGNHCGMLPELTELLQHTKSLMLNEASHMDVLEDIAEAITATICDEPPFSIREGGIVRDGFDDEVDRLRNLRDNGAQMVSALEQRERERTGIRKLKVGYNKVFGYYIDVPRTAAEQVPEDYIRKQTLVSNERFFTRELKELENTLMMAKEQLEDLEFHLFDALRGQVAEQVIRIQQAADTVAELDALCSLAEVAVHNHYVMPEVNLSRALSIQEGRHPVVEAAQKEIQFVPNDTLMNDNTDRVSIITGPNMAGKSTYMRQTALIVMMAQMGSFVPATSATIGVVDRVFTRIGASDDLAAGQSTFMVEMTEVAQILKHATAASLLILDEIGRGTSTYDGMAIARAVLEFCADKQRLGAKTMFATHYHELSALEHELSGVRNYNITAKKQNDTLIFLRKIAPGAADDSYGIEVAKLAGIPDPVIERAKQYLQELEQNLPIPNPAASVPAEEPQISLLDLREETVLQRLRAVDINTMTPLDAFQLLCELKKEMGA